MYYLKRSLTLKRTRQMKKTSLTVATLLLAGSVLCTSCIGSFSLFNKYEKWQCNMTKSKIVTCSRLWAAYVSLWMPLC